MTTFVLVHGAWHGAWCWSALEALLLADGHDVVAVDLPCSDPSASFEDYADVVLRAMPERSDDVVLVGHSLGGQTIPLVAAQRTVRRLVYVCALMASPGESLRQQIQREPDMFVRGYREGTEVVDDRGTSSWHDPAQAVVTMYADCPDDVAQAAVARLRPQATTLYSDVCALERLPDVPATYVLCSEDRIVSPEWSRRRAALHGLPVVQLPGSHSPFLSRPQELCDVLTAQG